METINLLADLIKDLGPLNLLIVVGLFFLLNVIPNLITTLITKSKMSTMKKTIQEIIENTLIIREKTDIYFEQNNEFQQSISRDFDVLLETISSITINIDKIQGIMRNVINEDDTLKIIKSFLGIVKNLRESLIRAIMSIADQKELFEIETYKAKCREDLVNNISSVWSDFKNQLNNFNFSANIMNLLDGYEHIFVERESYLYKKIYTILLSDISLEQKRSSIISYIDHLIRKINDEITKKISKNYI